MKRTYLIPRPMWNRITPDIMGTFNGLFALDDLYATLEYKEDSDIQEIKNWINNNATADPDFNNISEIMDEMKTDQA